MASAIGFSDTVYVSTFVSGGIDELDSNGNATTFASGYNFTYGLAFDASNNLYVAVGTGGAGGSIEKFTPNGTGSVFATSGISGPVDVAFDSEGNLYVANLHNSTIEKFNSAGQGSLFASTGLNEPDALAFDSSGNLYVANEGSDAIEKFAPNGSNSVFAANIDATGLAFNGGNLYAATFQNGTIVKFDSGGNGTVFTSALADPVGLAFDSSGNLYVADTGESKILKYDQSGSSSVFALVGARNITVLVPEPTTLVLVVLGCGLTLSSLRWRHRLS